MNCFVNLVKLKYKIVVWETNFIREYVHHFQRYIRKYKYFIFPKLFNVIIIPFKVLNIFLLQEHCKDLYTYKETVLSREMRWTRQKFTANACKFLQVKCVCRYLWYSVNFLKIWPVLDVSFKLMSLTRSTGDNTIISFQFHWIKSIFLHSVQVRWPNFLQ